MPDTVLYLVISTTIFVVLMFVFRIEEARGQRFLSPVRDWLDTMSGTVATVLLKLRLFMGAGTIRLFLHFVVHRALKVVLLLVRKLEGFFETRLRQNRRHATAISHDLERRSHLVEIAEHKQATALTEQEKRRMRAHY